MNVCFGFLRRVCFWISVQEALSPSIRRWCVAIGKDWQGWGFPQATQSRRHWDCWTIFTPPCYRSTKVAICKSNHAVDSVESSSLQWGLHLVSTSWCFLYILVSLVHVSESSGDITWGGDKTIAYCAVASSSQLKFLPHSSTRCWGLRQWVGVCEKGPDVCLHGRQWEMGYQTKCGRAL